MPQRNQFFNKPSAIMNHVIRPLDKGVILNKPSNQIPDGSVLTAENYIVGTEGPLRRLGTVRYASTVSVDYPPIRDVITLWKTDGTQVNVVLDQKFIYSVTTGGYTGQYSTYASGTVRASGTAVIGSGTAFNTNDIIKDDVIVFDPAGTPESVDISSVTDATNLTLESAPSGTYGTGTSYEIRRALEPTDPSFTDWVVLFDGTNNKIVFTNQNRTPYSFDGDNFAEYDTAIEFKAETTAFHRDRLWFGSVIDSGINYRQRVVWSNVTDRTTFDSASTYDIPTTYSKVKKMVPLANLLVVYFEDSIYIGRPSNIPSLPLVFEKVNTGGIGLVGPNAVVSWLDGQFFIGQDDIYFLSPSGGIQRIGSAIVKDTLRQNTSLVYAYAEVDPENDRILFGIPDGANSISAVWSFDYKAKAWSEDALSTSFIRRAAISANKTWADLSGTWASQTDRWVDFGAVTANFKIWLGSAGVLLKYEYDQTQDAGSSPIACILETGDFDYNNPDNVKVWTRATMKIDRTLASDLSFTVSASTDQGATYNQLGTLTIPAGRNEEMLGFILSGSHARFKFESSSAVQEYRIKELTFRVNGRGLESHELGQ